MTKYILGIDVACRAAHQGTLTDERGEFLWSARKFRSTTSDLESLWSSLPEDAELTVVMEPTRNAWVPLASWFQRRGAAVVMVPPEQSADLRDYYSKHTKSDRLDSRILARLPLLHPEGLHSLEGLGPADHLRRITKLRASLVKRRSVIAAVSTPTSSCSDRGGTRPSGRLGQQPLPASPRRWLGDPYAVRRLGRARLTKLIWRYSHGKCGEAEAQLLLEAAAASLELWDGDLDFAELADDIAVEARLALALSKEIHDSTSASPCHSRWPTLGHHDLGARGRGRDGRPDPRAPRRSRTRFRSLAGAKSFSGLVPSLSASGVHGHHGGPTKSGDAAVARSALYGGGLGAALDPTLAQRYYRLMVHEGKHHNSALCHVSATLLTRIIACWRAGTPYVIRDLDGTPAHQRQGRAIVARALHGQRSDPGATPNTEQGDEPSNEGVARRSVDRLVPNKARTAQIRT